MSLTNPQEIAIRCALADLIGAYQDWKLKGCPDSYHDWESHLQSIKELSNAFGLGVDEINKL